MTQDNLPDITTHESGAITWWDGEGDIWIGNWSTYYDGGLPREFGALGDISLGEPLTVRHQRVATPPRVIAAMRQYDREQGGDGRDRTGYRTCRVQVGDDVVLVTTHPAWA